MIIGSFDRPPEKLANYGFFQRAVAIDKAIRKFFMGKGSISNLEIGAGDGFILKYQTK
jgi:hypothetical protein